MNNSLESKEQIVHDFIHTISSIDSKPSDEIENNLQEIIQRTRSVIHQEQMWAYQKNIVW